MSSVTPDDSGGGAERLGAYRIIRQIGRGGQATVFLAEDTRLHRQVALKVLDPGFALAGPAFERFRREAEITSKLDHPGICTIYETGEDKGVLWIAMRYVEGDSLSKKISTAREALASGDTPSFALPVIEDRADPAPDHGHRDPPSGPKTWAEIAGILKLFEAAARTVHVANEAGVIHRDIKPRNMIVAKDGEPVILDFGLAQETEGDLPTLTMTGDLMGTPAYMSPEQIAAQRIRLDRRTDVYSLGVSLYECLALQRPFDAPTREGLYQAILTKEPPDLRTLNPAIPSDLRVVVATAIEKDRDRRYQTALDLAEELRRVRMHEPIVAKPVGPLVRLRRWSQRNPALATALLGFIAVLVTGLTIALVLLDKTRRAERDKDGALAEKSAALMDYDRLGDLTRLEALKQEAESLWTRDLPSVHDWVARANELADRLPQHQEVLEGLRAASGSTPTPAQQFKVETTQRLVDDLATFADPAKGVVAVTRAHLQFTKDFDTRWANAIRSIADRVECPQYGGLEIPPQQGLIPIGRDPGSGLWEFAHIHTTAPGTAPVPKRGADGRLVVTESMGVVLVLIPGGTFRMGAVTPTVGHPVGEANVDPDALSNEGPVTEITLDPFFLSKYEMSQGQWSRVTDKNPSYFVDLRNPVEQVSWEDCDQVLPRLGLAMPTEAQWEFGARAGTTTPRWTGSGTIDLDKAANLTGGAAPIGSLRANAFGLHDVLGNVWEWCRDWFGGYDVTPAPRDGLRAGSQSRARVFRGGSFGRDASYARSARRNSFTPGFRFNFLGVRPARRVSRN